ncbi:pyridoxal phosphate-dependent decarboxylase family protein [Protaetiibacter mangrovi]|uniref:Aminotransferase class V-fold PLP-dependent enzyme n=1 Tax=Protaetiibacter mangrovi TaxID=2970926 RepID=A0ABT1ZEA5_9MICO|nr:aminotransferase class V-fold PLP-dependent enzyme [Protaetiibacter mangrovi]MCS0499009.1 aminotransferase class V-fold PLP-dependent enzyme [Protaetiibacter mangrovi]
MNPAGDVDEIIGRLTAMRAVDPPTHGGRVLSYVYDPGLDELERVMKRAIQEVLPVNGLDPTTFRSVGVLESELVGFTRGLLNGDAEVVGSATSGGTESCLLAVKTARDVWREAHPEGRPRLLAPVTVHAAFQKAAHYFDLVLDLVPVSPEGEVDARDLVARLDDDVALVVVSAPNYPFAALDPVAEVAEAAAARGIPVHVDACIGGLVLPFWEDDAGEPLPAWDFRVPGVTSISADLHKYGYAPKGVSVLLQRGRDRQRHQYFATTRWPGYPVVNPTLLGSKSASPLAAGWAIAQWLGQGGFAELTASCLRSTRVLQATVDGIEGLRVVGEPTGPLFAVAVDDSVPAERRVDPHHWADAVRRHGFVLQLQPALAQEGGELLPSTTHLTITPVTESVVDELSAALVAGADAVRGVPHVDGAALLAGLPPLGALDSDTAWALLQGIGIGGGGELPDAQAPLLALIEALPAPIAERLLVELLGRLVEPR